ncbi:MAG: allose kinase [Eubacteriales bacterium]|nr:allose kinase [Eubacteriales bacterium]
MAKLYVCLELGGTHLRLGIVAEDFTLLRFEKLPTAILSEAEDKVACLAGLLQPLIDEAGRKNVVAVSLALASLMNRERSMVYSSPMVRGFDNIELKSLLQKKLGLPVYMEKDVNILLLYEIRKQSLPSQGIVAGIFLGTGLGNAFCIDGKVYQGFSGVACELGHIPVSGLHEPCGCGKEGCIELKACGSLLTKLAREFGCRVEELFVLHGLDAKLRDVICHFALAIATEVTILDPACVLLGGGVIHMPAFPLEDMLAQVRANVRTPYPRDTLRFEYASGDSMAGVVGAAIYAANR